MTNFLLLFLKMMLELFLLLMDMKDILILYA